MTSGAWTSDCGAGGVIYSQQRVVRIAGYAVRGRYLFCKITETGTIPAARLLPAADCLLPTTAAAGAQVAGLAMCAAIEGPMAG